MLSKTEIFLIEFFFLNIILVLFSISGILFNGFNFILKVLFVLLFILGGLIGLFIFLLSG